MNSQKIKKGDKNRKFNWLKILVVCLVVMLLVLTPLISFSQTGGGGAGGGGAGGGGRGGEGDAEFNLLNCASNPVTCALYIVSYVINSLLSLIFTFAAWLAKIALAFNNQLILETPTFIVGFNISLSVVNLGFVLLLIVIAVATILRSQTYGLKRLFVRLILAVILVNFSLVIAQTIIKTTNGIAIWFLEASTPSGVLTNKTAAFIDSITTAFAPHLFWAAPSASSSPTVSSTRKTIANALLKASLRAMGGSPIVGVALMGASGVVAGKALTDFSAFLQMVLTMLFGTIFLLLAAITMLALAILFLIRYVALGTLIIIMPFAWLFWVSPGLQQYWQKWWNSFLRWSFFAPVSIFFIYLAIIILQQMAFINKVESLEIDAPSWAGGGTTAEAIARVLANPNLLGVAGQMSVVILLVGAGLYVANQLSITGASIAVDSVKKIAGATVIWAGRKTAKGARWGYQKVGGEKLTDKLMSSSFRPFAALGRGLHNITTVANRKEIEAEKKKLENSGLTPAEIAKRLEGSMSVPKRLAGLEHLNEKNKLNLVEKIGGQSLGEFLEKNQTLLARYGGKNLLQTIQRDPILVGVAAIKQEKGNLSPELSQRLTGIFKKSPTFGYLSLDILTTSEGELAKLADKLGIKKEELKFLQEAVVRSIIQSPVAAATKKLKEIATEGRLEDFQQIASRMSLQPEDFDKFTLKWVDRSPAARNLGISRQTFFGQTSTSDTSSVSAEAPTPETPSPAGHSASGPSSTAGGIPDPSSSKAEAPPISKQPPSDSSS